MPRQLALALTFAFIVWLFRRDARESKGVTLAIWVPLTWMLISGSRFVGQWLELFSGQQATGAAEDGSPIDRLVFLLLIGAGVVILTKRRATIGQFVRNNVWLTIFFAYCFLAIGWSDFPFVALKRWVKTIGEPIMALVVLTEPDPSEALTRIMKRAGYILITFSVTFIKYYPEWGRIFSFWNGEAQNTGVADNKNGLGYLCLIFGAFFFCNFLCTRRLPKSLARRTEQLINLMFLGMIWWLVSIAGAKTGLMALFVTLGLVVLLEFRLMSKRFVGTYLLTVVALVLAADALFGLFSNLVDLLGKDSSLTGRIPLWKDLFLVDINPLLGAGFESFWLGDRLALMWTKYWWHPTQAHNGYIETYLNLGLLGILLLTALMIASFWKIRRDLLNDVPFATFRLGYLVALIIYNYTDATFHALHVLWLVFYMVVVEFPPIAARQVSPTPALQGIASAGALRPRTMGPGVRRSPAFGGAGER
jgi:exopolysaccharide production protein ExoQ